MGACASIHYSTNQPTLFIGNGPMGPLTTAKVIHSITGRLQEFRHPIPANHVLSDQKPDTFFLCNSENLFVNCHVPHVPDDEELQPGQLYFVMPVSRSHRPISLPEICSLAVKASSAIEKSEEMIQMKKMSKTTLVNGRRKSNNGKKTRKNEKVDFQLALKKL